MPTRLPVAARPPACVSQNSSSPFEVSCAAIGAAAIGLAIFIDRFCNDRTGAVLILLLAGILIGLLLHGPNRRSRE